MGREASCMPQQQRKSWSAVQLNGRQVPRSLYGTPSPSTAWSFGTPTCHRRCRRCLRSSGEVQCEALEQRIANGKTAWLRSYITAPSSAPSRSSLTVLTTAEHHRARRHIHRLHPVNHRPVNHYSNSIMKIGTQLILALAAYVVMTTAAPAKLNR